MNRHFLLGAIFFFILSISSIYAQDLMDLLEQETEEATQFTTATFKSTRVLNGHSIEQMKAGQLEFRISHRFGELNSGPYELFGLDQANIHFNLEYGILDWLEAGVGRGTFEKAFDGFIKFKILRQSTGKREMPVTLSLVSTTALNSLKWTDPERTNYFSSRLSYTNQILVARKFSERLSLQMSPTMVHRNLVQTELDPNDLYAFGLGMRYKLTQRLSFNTEYFYVWRPDISDPGIPYYNPFSIGFDIETGGHVFQLHITNSLAMIEKGFVGETTGNWLDGGIHFGFNISRVFTVK